MIRYIVCPTCHGEGSILKESVNLNGKEGQWWSRCPECNQSGRVIYKPTLAESEWIAQD